MEPEAPLPPAPEPAPADNAPLPTPEILENAPLDAPAPARGVPLMMVAILCGLMLAFGLAIGYTGRPLVVAYLYPSPTATATLPPPTATSEPPSQATQRAGLMSYVVANTRHFKGNPAAPVTLIEFGDFQ